MPDSAHAVRARSVAPRAGRLDDRLFLACGLSWGAGLIHLHAASDHLEEYALFSVFFVLLAMAQFVWGMAICRSPAADTLAVGAVLSLLVVILWIVSRTAGLPIGPAPWTPEPVGAIDTIASLDEAVLALLVLLQLSTQRAGIVLRGVRSVTAAGGVALVLLSSLAVTVPHTH